MTDSDPVRRDPQRRRAEARTPTEAMLALGTRAGVWTTRLLVLAFLASAVALALALL